MSRRAEHGRQGRLTCCSPSTAGAAPRRGRARGSCGSSDARFPAPLRLRRPVATSRRRASRRDEIRRRVRGCEHPRERSRSAFLERACRSRARSSRIRHEGRKERLCLIDTSAFEPGARLRVRVDLRDHAEARALARELVELRDSGSRARRRGSRSRATPRPCTSAAARPWRGCRRSPRASPRPRAAGRGRSRPRRRAACSRRTCGPRLRTRRRTGHERSIQAPG